MFIRVLAALSDTVSMSHDLFIKTGYNCIDSFLIYWQKAPTAGRYRLHSLGEKYLSRVSELADTALVQYKENSPGEWYAVAPVLANGIEGLRSYTFNFTKQQTGCYIRTFLADPAEINQARLTLELGTTYGVKKIWFEKLSDTAFVSIGEITPVNSTLNVFTTAAKNGLNIYRALVELENGMKYYSSPESVYVFDKQDYFVFPNPVHSGSSVKIMVKEPEGTTFVLYDLSGRKIMVTELTNTIQTIDISTLQRGVYMYMIIKDGVRTLSKKLVIL